MWVVCEGLAVSACQPGWDGLPLSRALRAALGVGGFWWVCPLPAPLQGSWACQAARPGASPAAWGGLLAPWPPTPRPWPPQIRKERARKRGGAAPHRCQQPGGHASLLCPPISPAAQLQVLPRVAVLAALPLPSQLDADQDDLRNGKSVLEIGGAEPYLACQGWVEATASGQKQRFMGGSPAEQNSHKEGGPHPSSTCSGSLGGGPL